MRRAFLAISILTSLRPTGAAETATKPVVQLRQTAVVATNVTKNGDVVFFAIARTPRDGWTEIRHWHRLVRVDSQAAASVDLPTGVPTHSVWGVVDVASGGVAFALPDESLFHEVPFLPMVLHRDDSEEFDRFISGRARLDLLWIRPHVGAWSFSGGDGALADADRASDGSLAVSPGSLTALGSVPTPSKFQSGDLLLLIDPHAFEFSWTEVGK